MTSPKPSIPDPALFQRSGRPCLTFEATENNERVGLCVIWLDNADVEFYGDMSKGARAWWLNVAREGKNLLQRTLDAEQRVRDVETGLVAGYRAELRSRFVDLTAKINPAHLGAMIFDLASDADRERLMKALGFDP